MGAGSDLGRQIATQRAFFTGESVEQAVAAIGRRATHALDLCSPGQRRFRVLLAMLELNTADGLAEIPGQRELSAWRVALTARPRTWFSPCEHGLVVLSDAPHTLADMALVPPDPGSPSGIPGLRPLSAHPAGLWFRFYHIPTQAVLRIELSSGATCAGELPISWDVAVRSPKLTEPERKTLTSVPPAHADAERLLAALSVRLTMSDAGVRRWQTLWGRGQHWALHCASMRAVSGLTELLTDPVIGLAGAAVSARTTGSFVISYRKATLRLSALAPGSQCTASAVQGA